MPDTTVAIIGAGIGGIYLAAELGRRGCRLRLHDIDDGRLLPIRERGGLDIEGDDAGFVAVERVTTDPAAAIEGADIIAVCTGGAYQEAVGHGLASLLRDGQSILLIQGNTGGSLVVRRALDAAGCRARVDIAEMDNYPYSCWRLGPTRIRPIVHKKFLQIASFPGSRIDAVFTRLAPLFPSAIAAPSIVSTGFTNANAMLHVANCVANAGKIDRGEAYKFYAEGVTPAVGRLYTAINAERVAVAAALGASVPNLEDWFERTYGVRGKSLSETCQLLTTNSDGPYQATRHAVLLDAQIHRRGRAGRIDADERAWRGGGGGDPGDRRRYPAGADARRPRFRRRGAHPGTHGARRNGRRADPANAARWLPLIARVASTQIDRPPSIRVGAIDLIGRRSNPARHCCRLSRSGLVP